MRHGLMLGSRLGSSVEIIIEQISKTELRITPGARLGTEPGPIHGVELVAGTKLGLAFG